MFGSGSFSNGYGIGSKRPRLMETNPYYGSGGGFHVQSFPVVRLRGLPYDCSDVDIFKFFSGLDVVDVLLTNKHGRFSGEAFVVFAGSTQAEFALQRDRQNMGRRYVEVFRCNKQDYYNAIADEVNSEGVGGYHSPPRAPKRSTEKEHLEHTEILKLRGLPYSTKKSDIIDFFHEFDLSEANVHIVSRYDGKATGEAFVEFASASDSEKAMDKDRLTMGSRYVELFPSTPEELRRVASRSRS